VDYVEMPIQLAAVDTTSTNTQKNKLVSNAQALDWTAKPHMVVKTIYPSTDAVHTDRWTVSGIGCSYNFSHGLNNFYPIGVAYKASTAGTVTTTIISVSINVAQIIVAVDDTYNVTLIG
jgi:hypothetical protein